MSVAAAPLSDVFRVLDLIGVFTSAALGAVIARSARLDLVGLTVIALLSGLGGGVLRDTLLQHGTPIALTDYAYVLTALAAAALAFVVPFQSRAWNWTWPVIDAVALGSWAAAGAQKTLFVGLGWLPAILLGTVTAVGGGMIRDIVLRRVPAVLGGTTLYATCAVAASALMVVFQRSGHARVGLVVATVFGGGLCLLARRRGWMLPADLSHRLPARLRRSPR